MKSLKVAVYIRVSTQMQVEEGYSLAAQKERLKAFAYSQGWEIVQYYVDEGVSAKDLNRPELQRMLKDMKAKLFDIVLVYKLDRLTRSVIDLDKLLTEFNKYDVKFKSSTEIYDTTTATGRLFIRLVASMAQWERENLSERVSFGMEQKAKEGKWVINVPPFGYDRTTEGYLEIIEHEAAIVKQIYKMYLSGKYGIAKIAKFLNENNLLTKSGSYWNDATVKYILTNPLYKGTMRYNYRVNKENYFEIEDAVPSIITTEEYEMAQQLLKTRSTNHPRRATSPYIFTTVLKCSRCGGTMYGHQSQTKRNGKKYISYNYYCVNRRFGTCDLPNIAQNFLEHQFLNIVDKWILDNDTIVEVVSETEKEDDNTHRIKTIRTELSEIEKRRKKWQYAWANELISDEDFKERSKEEDEKEKLLLDELKKLQGSIKKEMDIELLTETLKDIRKNWNQLEIHEKKHLVNIAVKTIEVDKDEKFSRKPESVIITNIEYN